MTELFDTHCHIHFDDYQHDPDEVIENAVSAGVNRLLCVGCTLEDSKAGVEFVQDRENCWMSIGLHPHEAHHYVDDKVALNEFAALIDKPKVMAIGECGLDYYYNHSPKEAQIRLLEFQLQLASDNNLPLVFHIRDAFEDFWPIFDNFNGLKGVIHSFTAHQEQLTDILNRNLYVSLNGIMTFTKDAEQLKAAKAVPLDKLIVETDAPFLTPAPYRGKICEPKHVRVTAEFLAILRGESLESLASSSTRNALTLFGI